MTNRRDFLQGATLAAVPLVSSLPPDAVAGTDGPVPRFHAVLVDPRHAESLSFGARLAARGATVKSVREGDITPLWLDDIGPAWREAPVAIAGLTRPPVLFCLEQLAWAHGLRVVFHAEHVIQADSAPGHSLHRRSERPGMPDVDGILTRGPLWPAQVADLVAAQGRLTNPPPAGPSLAALQPRLPRGAELLTSWIIAPA